MSYLELKKPRAVRVILLLPHGEAETYVLESWPSEYYLAGLIAGRKVFELRVEAIYLPAID